MNYPSGVRSFIMPRLPTHLIQELNAVTVGVNIKNIFSDGIFSMGKINIAFMVVLFDLHASQDTNLAVRQIVAENCIERSKLKSLVQFSAQKSYNRWFDTNSFCSEMYVQYRHLILAPVDRTSDSAW